MISRLKLKQIINWLDKNLLFVQALFLIAFIPLYPKLPLLDAIPGYIVRVRLEDIVVFITGLTWLIQWKRGQFKLPTTWITLFAGYGLVGLLSLVFAMVVLQSIPLQPIHIGKSALHWLRYLEYFSLFFVMLAAINTKKRLKIALGVLVATILAITLYGFGQKYMQFPLYSTMNREFSKGERLYLTEFARVQSTFGGHYDMSAYLVLTLPILYALALKIEDWRYKLGLLGVHVGGLVLMVIGSSKTSLVAYFIGMFIVTGFFLAKAGRGWLYKVFVGSLVSGLAVVALSFLIIFLGGDTYKSFLNLMSQTPHLNKVATRLEMIVEPSDEDSQMSEDRKNKPADVYVDVPDTQNVATISATGATKIITIEKERQWSENAIKYGLSMGIRLDTLWPQALKGFSRNLFLGKGYATLNKQGDNEFTEADSTDNNFLRALGETGLAGFTTFFGLILIITLTSKQNLKTKDRLSQGLNIGFLGASIGLLINSLYIDVFAASKVAFSYWTMAGLAVSNFYITKPKEAKALDKKRLQKIVSIGRKHWPLIGVFVISALLIHHNPISNQSLLKDLPSYLHSSRSYEIVSTVRCFWQTETWSLCQDGEAIKPGVYSLYTLALVPLLKSGQNLALYFYFNLALAFVSIYLLFKIISLLTRSNKVKFLATGTFVTQPLFFNLVVSPVPENLSLPSLLLAIHSFLNTKQKHRPIWILIGLGGLVLSKPWLDIDSLVLLVPLIIIGLVFAWRKAQTTVSKVILISVWVGLLFSAQIWNIPKQITSNFRQSKQPLNYMAIKTANQHLYLYDSKPESAQPLIIGNINPYLVDFYGLNYVNVAPVPDAEKLTDYQTQLQNGKPLFTTNLNVNSDPDISEAFEDIKNAFDLRYSVVGCEELCSMFELLPAGSRQLLPAQTVQELPIIDPYLESDFSFVITKNIFNFDRKLADKALPNLKNKLTTINSLNPEFLLILGEDMTNPYPLHDRLITNYELAEVDPLPLIFTPGISGGKEAVRLFGPNKQAFQIGQTVFLSLETSMEDRNTAQELLVFDTLLYIEQRPEINNLIIIGNELNWTLGNPELEHLTNLFSYDHRYQTINDVWSSKILPKIKTISKDRQAQGINFSTHVITGHLAETEKPNILFVADLDANLEYVSIDIDNYRHDISLEIQTSPDGQLEIVPFSLRGVELKPLESYQP